jgi:hypothetical protein
VAATKNLDAASLLLGGGADAREVAQELQLRLAGLAPYMIVPAAKQQVVLVLPKSEAGRALRETLTASAAEIETAVLNSDDDVILCHETAGVDLQEMAGILSGDPDRYLDAAAQVVSRVDVPWFWLEVSQVSP